MKRLIPALILLLSTAAICFAGTLTVNRYCNSAKAELGEIIEDYNGGKEKALTRAKEFKKDWDKERRILALFVNHGLLDGISEEVSALPVCISERASTELYICKEKIERFLSQIIGEENVGIESFY